VKADRCFILGLLFIAAAGLAPVYAKTFSFSADQTTIVLAKGKERTVLTGNARIVSEDTTILAHQIEIYGNNFRYATCRGNVRVTDRKQNVYLTSDSLYFDREADITRAEGNVVMEDRENETIVKGGFLENQNKDKSTIVQIGVRILGEDLTTRSEFARYQRADNILELSGLPVVYWKGDQYEASRIVINLDSDEITLQGDVSGTITSEDSNANGGTQDNEATP